MQTAKLALSGALIGLPLMLAAHAETVSLDEVVVTAQKRSESIEKVPISIKVLGSDTLESTNADGLADITRLVPSMSMTNLGRGGNNVQIRGLGSNVGSVGTVAIYNDGIIAATRVQSSGTFAEQDATLFDVERVEVLRGPQGTLYGEGSFGGVINIISKRPDVKAFDAGFSGSWSSIKDGASGSNDLNGMVNIPLVQDMLAVRLVGFRSDQKGFLDGYDLLPVFAGGAPTLVGKNLNGEKVTGGRVSVGLVRDSMDATLILKRQKTDVNLLSLESDYLDILKTTLPGGTTNATGFFGTSPIANGSKRTTDEGVLEVNFKTAYGVLTSLSGWGKDDATSIADTASVSNPHSDTKAWSEELRFSANNDGPINWIAGAYYRNVKRNAVIADAPALSNKVDEWSVFGQVYWNLTPTVKATLGLRYGEQKSVVDDLLNAAVLGPLSRAQATFSDLSPKFALDWQFNEETLLYASIAKGFRGGGANVDRSLGTDSAYNRDFRSDSIWNYEIGEKAVLWNKKVTINAALFYIDWKNIQIDHPITDLTNPSNLGNISFIVTNGDRAHSYGFETDIYWNPREDWEIVLGGSLVNAQYDGGTIDSASGTFPLKGQHLPSAPERLFNASVTKTFVFGATGLRGLLRADYSSRGNSFADVPNDPPGSDFNSRTMNNVNLRASVLGKQWEVQGFVTNVGNSDGSAFNFHSSDLLYRAKQQPRTLGVNVKWHYR